MTLLTLEITLGVYSRHVPYLEVLAVLVVSLMISWLYALKIVGHYLMLLGQSLIAQSACRVELLYDVVVSYSRL